MSLANSVAKVSHLGRSIFLGIVVWYFWFCSLFMYFWFVWFVVFLRSCFFVEVFVCQNPFFVVIYDLIWHHCVSFISPNKPQSNHQIKEKHYHIATKPPSSYPTNHQEQLKDSQSISTLNAINYSTSKSSHMTTKTPQTAKILQASHQELARTRRAQSEPTLEIIIEKSPDAQVQATSCCCFGTTCAPHPSVWPAWLLGKRSTTFADGAPGVF